MSDRRSLWERIQRQETAAQEADRLFQARSAKQVAVQMETVIGHEGWDLYVAHLTALKDSAWQTVEAKGRLILGTPMPPVDLAMHREIRARILGQVEGLDMALQTITDLIARGRPPQEEPNAA